MTLVDVHSHFWPTDLQNINSPFAPKFDIGMDGRGSWKIDYGNGYQLGLSDVDMRVRTDAQARLADMDTKGIDVQVLSPSPTVYMYWADKNTSIKFCRTCNDSISKAARTFHDRFIGNAILPLQDIPASLVELERAVHDLELRGVMLGSNINERNLDDEAFSPIFDRAESLGVPLFIHSPPLFRNDRLMHYDLFWALGYLIDESIAIAALILGGVLEDFPKLKIYVPHGGGMLPYQLGRMQKLSEVRPKAKERMKGEFKDYFKKLYFDLTLSGIQELQFLVSVVGANRLLYGTNYPNWGEGIDYVEAVESLEISGNDKKRIFHGNAVELFDIK